MTTTYLIGGRRSGKTTVLVEWLLEEPETHQDKVRVAVVANEGFATELLAHIRKEEPTFPAWRITTVERANRDLRGLAGRVVLSVDNLESLLVRVLGGHPVEIVTATGDVVDLGDHPDLVGKAR